MKRLLLEYLKDEGCHSKGRLISKEIERIFQRVGEVIDENQKKNRAQNAASRKSSLDRKRG